MNRVYKIIGLFLLVCIITGMIPQMVFAEGTGAVPIDETHFPDANFREYITSEFDKDKNGVLDSQETAPRIDTVDGVQMPGQLIIVDNKGISDLKGIEYFPSLTELNCSGNNLKGLDLTKNIALKSLDCSDNNLSELDLANNTALTRIYCNNNHISKINLTKNLELVSLLCGNNELEQLDISKNTALCYFDCSNNKLSELDVKCNTKLKGLSCGNNQISKLDTEQNSELESLNCCNNRLSQLELSGNPKLQFLNCNGNQISGLNISENKSLEGVECSNNKLSEIISKMNNKMRTLNCNGNKLKKLDSELFPNLKHLECANNAIKKLKLSSNKKIIILKCDGNKFKSIKIPESVRAIVHSKKNFKYTGGKKAYDLYLSQKNLSEVKCAPYYYELCINKGCDYKFRITAPVSHKKVKWSAYPTMTGKKDKSIVTVNKKGNINIKKVNSDSNVSVDWNTSKGKEYGIRFKITVR